MDGSISTSSTPSRSEKSATTWLLTTARSMTASWMALSTTLVTCVPSLMTKPMMVSEGSDTLPINFDYQENLD
jgi:hypothetical protein